MSDHKDMFGAELKVGDMVHIPRGQLFKITKLEYMEEHEVSIINQGPGSCCSDDVIKYGTIFTRSEVEVIVAEAIAYIDGFPFQYYLPDASAAVDRFLEGRSHE